MCTDQSMVEIVLRAVLASRQCLRHYWTLDHRLCFDISRTFAFFTHHLSLLVSTLPALHSHRVRSMQHETRISGG